MYNTVLIVISLVLAAFRVCGDTSQIFQAMAHVFCGWLIADWWFTKRPMGGILVIVLSVIEVACAVYFHFHPTPVTKIT